jgi:hypothetical protein
MLKLRKKDNTYYLTNQYSSPPSGLKEGH